MALNLQRVLTLKQLRLVSVLGRELNLSRCADILHSTQPAASRALAQLEDQLQVILFQRTTKRNCLSVSTRCKFKAMINHTHSGMNRAALFICHATRDFE